MPDLDEFLEKFVFQRHGIVCYDVLTAVLSGVGASLSDSADGLLISSAAVASARRPER